MTKYKVKFEVKLKGETLKILKEVRASDFPEAVEKVVNNIVETMGVNPWMIDNFECIL